jgi:hypothetical protein
LHMPVKFDIMKPIKKPFVVLIMEVCEE